MERNEEYEGQLKKQTPGSRSAKTRNHLRTNEIDLLVIDHTISAIEVKLNKSSKDESLVERKRSVSEPLKSITVNVVDFLCDFYSR